MAEEAAMNTSKERDPFEKVLDDADAFHEAALKSLPPDLKRVADDVLQAVLRQAKARPIVALVIAAVVGFLIASMTSK